MALSLKYNTWNNSYKGSKVQFKWILSFIYLNQTWSSIDLNLFHIKRPFVLIAEIWMFSFKPIGINK